MDSARSTCPECGGALPTDGMLCLRCCLGLAAQTDIGDTTASSETAGTAKPAFGDYELVERLGEGGMGVVYKAWHRKLKRTVALKMLRSGEVGRFRLEAQAAARLCHPNIVRIHEVGEHQGRPFFSMDYIQGRSLSEIVGRTPLPPRRAAAYVKTLAEAMHFAHVHSVLHRDLKPANVLVDNQDQVYITDFGLAKVLDSDVEVTLSGAILGTPSYMSPEQASSKRKEIAAATDIYSLGAVLYDLLTGRPPFRADSPTETMRQVIELEPAPPRLLNAKVDKDLETICLKCLSKQPGHRYDSAQALAEDLARFLRNEPIQARPLGWWTRSYRWLHRNPVAALAGTLLAIVLGSQVIAAVWSRRDAFEKVYYAPAVAQLVSSELKRAGDHVEALLASPEAEQIRQLLLSDPDPRLPQAQTSVDNAFNQKLRSLYQAGPSTSNRFDNLMVQNMTGDVMGYYNPNLHHPLPNLSHRDYFRGATNLMSGFYVSRAYKSLSDSTYKVGISAPIRSGGRCIGVFSAMIGTRSTDTGVRLNLNVERTKTVLVSPLDDPREPNGYIVFWHPAYERKLTNVVSITDHRLTELLKRAQAGQEEGLWTHNYRDPVGEVIPWYRGRWVAGFAPVPGTPFIVIEQARDRVAIALVSDGLICGAVLAFSFGRYVWLRRERSSAVTPPP